MSQSDYQPSADSETPLSIFSMLQGEDWNSKNEDCSYNVNARRLHHEIVELKEQTGNWTSLQQINARELKSALEEWKDERQTIESSLEAIRKENESHKAIVHQTMDTAIDLNKATNLKLEKVELMIQRLFSLLPSNQELDYYMANRKNSTTQEQQDFIATGSKRKRRQLLSSSDIDSD